MLLNNAASRISFSLNLVASLSLISMVFLTVADVSFRYFFNHPITGTYDLVSLMGAIVASFSMPYTLLEKGHVAVEILVKHLSKTKQLIIDSGVHMISLILFIIISWQCILLANDMRNSGEVTPTLLVPFYPIVYCMAICFCVLCLVIFASLLRIWMEGVKE